MKELHQLCLQYTWVYVWDQGRLAQNEFGCTGVETGQSKLWRQVFQSWAAKAEENLCAKCVKCSFNSNVNEEQNILMPSLPSWGGEYNSL